MVNPMSTTYACESGGTLNKDNCIVTVTTAYY